MMNGPFGGWAVLRLTVGGPCAAPRAPSRLLAMVALGIWTLELAPPCRWGRIPQEGCSTHLSFEACFGRLVILAAFLRGLNPLLEVCCIQVVGLLGQLLYGSRQLSCQFGARAAGSSPHGLQDFIGEQNDSADRGHFGLFIVGERCQNVLSERQCAGRPPSGVVASCKPSTSGPARDDQSVGACCSQRRRCSPELGEGPEDHLPPLSHAWPGGSVEGWLDDCRLLHHHAVSLLESSRTSGGCEVPGALF